MNAQLIEPMDPRITIKGPRRLITTYCSEVPVLKDERTALEGKAPDKAPPSAKPDKRIAFHEALGTLRLAPPNRLIHREWGQRGGCLALIPLLGN